MHNQASAWLRSHNNHLMLDTQATNTNDGNANEHEGSSNALIKELNQFTIENNTTAQRERVDSYLSKQFSFHCG